MLRTSSIDCRLLSASNCAYFVQLDGKFKTPSKGEQGYCFYKNVGFTSPVIPFVGGADNINAAILGETDSNYILAFRGTLPLKPYCCASWLDWAQDILESEVVTAKGLPGKVHKGMHDAFRSIRPEIFSHLSKIYVEGKSNKPLLITGHSKGGPMASYAAYIAKKAGFPVSHVVTFASPHPGDVDFAKIYNATVHQFRYENDLDIVPFLPPTCSEIDMIIDVLDLIKPFPGLSDLKKWLKYAAQWNYTSVGTLKFINYKHQIVPNSPSLWISRLWDFVYDFWENGLEKGFEKIADAHSIGCGGGYQKGVCPNLCTQ